MRTETVMLLVGVCAIIAACALELAHQSSDRLDELERGLDLPEAMEGE